MTTTVCMLHALRCPPGCLAPRMEPTPNHPEYLPQPAPKPGIAIAEIPIDLERGQQILKCKLKAPGIVRALGVWLKEPKVLGSASMRATEKIAMPMLFVECDPAGEMLEKVFLFIPSNIDFSPADGYRAEYRATSVSQVGAVHCFEIVEAKS